MNEREVLALIERDRGAPLPEGPDARWIAARVRVQLQEQTAEPDKGEGGLLVALAVLGAAVPGALLLYIGQPGWLLLWPGLLLLLAPLMLMKGADHR